MMTTLIRLQAEIKSLEERCAFLEGEIEKLTKELDRVRKKPLQEEK